jgi:predicted  nucleic acid-binding Zn-ribbon protein
MNLEKIQDKERKREREEKFNSIEKDMQILHIEIDDWEKKLEEIEFDLPSDVKRFEFYRNLSKRVWLSHIAIIIKES